MTAITRCRKHLSAFHPKRRDQPFLHGATTPVTNSLAVDNSRVRKSGFQKCKLCPSATMLEGFQKFRPTGNTAHISRFFHDKWTLT